MTNPHPAQDPTDPNIMNPTICFETPRLILRTVTLADIDVVASCWALDAPPITREEAEQKIIGMLSNHAQNRPGTLKHLCLAIIRKDNGEFIGWCGLDHLDPDQPDPALFYLLKKRDWGKGYATEAAMALLRYAFAYLDLGSIHGGAAPENLASKRVMEKLGMQYIGMDEGGGYHFRMTAADYFTGQVGSEKPRLIFIGGEAWTGKSTCSRMLLHRLYNAAWLDGDDVWRVNPWSLDDPRLRTSDINMVFVLQTYLQSKFDYVILSSIVLCDQGVTARILDRIRGVDYDLLSFTLICDEEGLVERAQQRDGVTSPHFLFLDGTVLKN